LIEHFAGAFPIWVAPEQVRVLPIADRHTAYATQVRDRLVAAGIRAEVDVSNQRMGYKIRQAQVEHIPYMAVVGDKEAAAEAVAVRSRSAGDLGPFPVAEFLARVQEEVAAKV